MHERDSRFEPPGGLDDRFCEVMDAAPVMIWISGQDKLCTWFNEPWLAFTGRTLAQELGNGWAEGVHPHDFDRCWEIYVRHFDARQQFRMQYRLRRHDGEYRWIDDIGIPRKARDGNFLGYIGSCTDIHEQREMQRTSLQSVLNTALDAVIVMDTGGIIVDWNEIASDTFGWTRNEAVGAILCDLIIPQPFRDAHQRGLEAFLRTGVGPVLRKRIEVTALRKNGEEFPVELSITPYVDDNALLFLGFLRDITARKHAAERLEQQALQARLLYETISFAAQTISFEDALRTCLEAVHTLTGWPVGHVYLPTDTDPVLILPSGIWYPPSEEQYQSLKAVTAQAKFAVGEGLPGLVMQTGEPIWIADVVTDARFPRSKVIRDLGITSALGFPIKNANSVIAVIEFFTPVQSEPNPEMMLILRSIGDQVGRVFERRQSEMKLRQHSEHQKLLLAELNHRVKNMLAVVAGIASQTMRNSASMQEFNNSFQQRLNALSQAHGLLASKNWGPTPFKDLVNIVLAPYVSAASQISVDGPALDLQPKPALSISLLLHELITNAAKYGALSQPNAHLSVHWNTAPKDPSYLQLTWQETGVSDVTKPSRTGFGTRLINTTVKSELQGNIETQFGIDGVRHRMNLQIAPTVRLDKTQ